MEHLKFEEGFRFRPTDSEGLTFLLRFVAGQEMHDSGFITTNVDVYGKQEPWEIYDSGVPCGDDEDNSSYRYFITKLKKKSNARYHRSVGNKGTWKQDNKGKPVHYKNMGNSSSVVNIGSKTSLSYKNKKFYPEDQKDGHWLMKEYELSKVILHKFDQDRRDYVLCAIKKLKHVNSSSETSTITTLNNVSEGTDEVTSSVDDLLATNNCKGYYNLEHSETLAFQESMVMNNSVFEPLQVVAEPAEFPDYLYQWDGPELNQILDGVPEVDVAVDIVEPLPAAAEPTEATYTYGQHSVEATARYDPSMPDMSINSAHIEHSKVANMSQMNLMSFDQSVPEDVLGLDPWDIMDSNELNRMLEDVSECCPDGC
ncbi:NAC domain-containing protein 40-like [Nicotiana sylvestris]|uniref:Protein ATAF2-like n=1 Tax=Nicotiana sylvestris TaxID=4096 RepID=A0A1U7W8K2_NICSY|nr:PREDICTED: protein ATAF2-like [Nicotiana sylvestris]